MQPRIYFDNAATTPLDEAVLAEMMPYLTNHFGNPSAVHAYGRTTRAAIEKARKQVAQALQVSPGEIFFTSSGTEANNTAIKGAVTSLGVKKIITSKIEHHCVLHSVEACHEIYGTEIVFLNNNELGEFDLNQLEQELANSKVPVLVTLMHANNEIGTMMDLETVSRLCKTYNAYFHTDTVQTIGHYQFNLAENPVHFLSGSGHKLHGPKGIGFLYIHPDIHIHPFVHGGSQERNMRAGTENLYGIVGLGKAIELAYQNFENYRDSTQQVKSYMKLQLMNNFENIQFNGADINSLYTVLSVAFPPSPKNEMLLFSLDISGIAASGGSACTSGSDKGSHVLQAIGMDPQRKGIRFSFSHHNHLAEVDDVISQLKEILK